MSQSHFKKTAFALFCLSLSVVQAKESRRIISVGGAATEIVFALGYGDEVVAVDLSSTYPREVFMLPKVGYIRNISPEGILSMEPDLVVTTESMGPPAAKEMMKAVNVPVLWLPEPDSLESLKVSLEASGKQLGNPEAAQELYEQVEANISEASDKASEWNDKPTVLFLMQPPTASRPGMVAGSDTRAQELMELAGGQNAAKNVRTYQPYSAEAILQANPDVILVGLSEGHGATEASLRELQQLAVLQPVKAYQSGKIYGVPMDDLNFGPRLGEAVLRWNSLIAPPQKAMN